MTQIFGLHLLNDTPNCQIAFEYIIITEFYIQCMLDTPDTSFAGEFFILCMLDNMEDRPFAVII